MDILKFAILAFIAAGIVLGMLNIGYVQAILISGGVTIVVMIIAVIRSRRHDRLQKPKEKELEGPTIK